MREMAIASLSVSAPRLCRTAPAPGRSSRPTHVCRANYRWSAEDAGTRKRESLYSAEQQGGGPAGDNGAASNGGSTPSASSGWPEEWQQWLNVNEAAQQQQQQQQQDTWAAAGSSGSRLRSSRLAARRQARAAAAAAAASRRNQQQQQQTPGEPQQPVADAQDEQAEEPWVQSEMRQLRSRQAARGSQMGPAGEARQQQEGGAPLPDPWAQEWGPSQGSPAAAAKAAEDFGWGEESWAAGGGDASSWQQRAREEAAAAGMGPGSSWELAQQQREMRRQRRRAAAGRNGSASVYDNDEGEDGIGAASAGGYYSTAGAGGPFDAQQQQQDDGSSTGSGPGYGDAYGASGQRQEGQWEGGTEQHGEGAAQYDEQYSEWYEPGEMVEPDIALLSSEELDRVLPVVPFSQQADFFSGSATDSVQRWGASLAATVVLSKVAVLAATSLTWPLWWPWALAAKKNLALRRQYSYGGLWRTQVLEVTITGRPRPFASLDGGQRGGTLRVARVLVGDPGGARTEMVLPYDSRYELIRGGEPAELVVLSGDTSFQRFKAVKDVYLPNSGLWVSEYPHLDRTQLLEVSLQVEREAQEAAAAGQWEAGTSAAAGQYDGEQYGGTWQQDDFSARSQY